jgi:hypothetical protein
MHSTNRTSNTFGALGAALLAALVSACSGSTAISIVTDGGDAAVSDGSVPKDGGADGRVTGDGGTADATADGTIDGTAPLDGGDDASDAGSNADVIDAATDAASEASADASDDVATDAPATTDAADAALDANSDAAPSCGADGAACTDGTAQGLCSAGSCGACTPVTDDAACAAAYGLGHLCIGGACVPGNCRTDGNCPTGEICGLSTPNECGACTSDGQCIADSTYGATFICNTTSGACVAGTCTTADTTCTANASDVCCASACVPGNCCDDAFCHTSKGNSYACVAHTCTTCDAVPAKTYVVDPANGSDVSATGSDTAGGTTTASCAFKTISRALAVIGKTPAAGTIILVKNTGTVGAGETFPITVPANVTITGASGAVPTVDVPANKTGFTLSGASSGLAYLTIDGTALAGTTGVVATTGSAATTTLANVTVQHMANDGIDVINAGVLTIGPGTNSQSNGTAAAPASGLVVNGTGAAHIVVDTGAAATFNNNTAHGIQVAGAGSISIGTDQGSLSPAAIASGNTIANLYIQQTPSAGGGAAPENNVFNFEASGSVTTHGIHIFGGSSLTLRKSQVFGNKLDGVFVTTGGGAITPNNDVSHIDLGTSANFGHNVLQAATGATPAPNLGAGICLNLSALAGQTLNAAGNTFELADCSTANPGAIKRANTCTGGTDIAITGLATTNNITTLNCTHP